MFALVVGFGGKSGVAAVNYLLGKGYYVRANDIRPKEKLQNWINQVKVDKVEFVLGHHNKEILNDIDMVVISPGVPSDLKLFEIARGKNIPVLSEVELAYMEYPHNWICITGTDGKSTTTSLIGEIFKTAGRKSIVAGNIGFALTEKIKKINTDDYFVIAELSSFQLENINKLKPMISVILNLDADHLDRYKNMNEYAQAKFNIFKNQDNDDYLVLNKDSKLLNKYISEKNMSAEVFWFSRKEKINKGAYLSDNKFLYALDNLIEEIFEDGIQKLQGLHNKENILAAVTVAKLAGIENKYIKTAVENFKGLEHRTELAAVINNRKFINDSKATTISSVKMSLSAFDDDIIAIMGGRDKGLDFSVLNKVLSEKVKYLILIGEARGKIKSMIDYPANKIFETDDLEEAVYKAYDVSKEGDIIILAPGCTSYDMFKNFEERGKAFKNIVEKIKAENEKK